MRSYGVTESLAQTLSPLFVSIPATDRMPDKNGKKTNCAMDQRSVRMLVEDGDDVPEIEVACLTAAEDAPGMTVFVTNVVTGERRCGGTLADGRFRVPIPATIGERLELTIYNTPNAVTDYGTCNLKADAVLGRRITTWEQQAPRYNKVADGNAGCQADMGCAQFMANFFPVGSPLVAPQDGLGYARNTPLYRKFAALAQTAFDPADPINYAPYYFLRDLLDPDGKVVPPRGLMNINTVGDGFVSIATGVSFARAAGVVPFFPPSALDLYPEYKEYVTPPALYELYSRKTPLRVLIETHLVEGIARLQRHPAGPSCNVNYRMDDPVTCNRIPAPNYMTCLDTLFDVDWFAEGAQQYDAQHLVSPLRLARRADTHIIDQASLTKAWEPRITGAPLANDDAKAWRADSRVLALTNVYIQPEGKHTWETGDYCKLWDDATYGGNLAGHFLSSGGKDPYYLSHPRTHECLQTKNCPFYQ
jgi:hypothetical protein